MYVFLKSYIVHLVNFKAVDVITFGNIWKSHLVNVVKIENNSRIFDTNL